MLQSVIPLIRIFDVAKAIEFYVDWLGFKIEWEHRFEANFPVYMEISRDGVKFHLTGHHGDCSPGSRNFIICTNLRSYCEMLQAKNYKFYKPAVEETFYNARAWR